MAYVTKFLATPKLSSCMISLGNSAKALRLIPNCWNSSVGGDYKDTLEAQNQLFAHKLTSIGLEENGLRIPFTYAPPTASPFSNIFFLNFFTSLTYSSSSMRALRVRLLVSRRLPNAYVSIFGIKQSGQGWALWCDRPVIRHLGMASQQSSTRGDKGFFHFSGCPPNNSGFWRNVTSLHEVEETRDHKRELRNEGKQDCFR